MKHFKPTALKYVLVLSTLSTAQMSAIGAHPVDQIGAAPDWYSVSEASTPNDLDVLVNRDMSGVTEAVIHVDADCTASASITTSESIYWVESIGYPILVQSLG